MSGSKRVATAFILSCAIYLTPLVGPHAVFLLGEVLWRDVGHALRSGGDRDLAWIATDLGVALLTQLVLLLLLHRLLRRPGLFRKLCIGLSVVSAVVVLNYAYMSAIPRRFLLQPDTALERDTWPLQCAAHKVWIPQIASAPTLLRGAPIWVAEVYPPNRYGLFEAANCAVTPLSLAQSAAGYVTYVAGTSRALPVGAAADRASELVRIRCRIRHEDAARAGPDGPGPVSDSLDRWRFGGMVAAGRGGDAAD